MKNKKLLKAGLVTAAVVLSCSMLFGCGNDKPKDSKPESSASAKHEAEGETPTSKFSGDKKSASPEKRVQTTQRPYSSSSPGSADSGTNNKTGSSSVSNNSVPSQSQSELDDAESFLNSGMYTDAREMLNSIDKSGLSDSQLTQYESIESRLENHENSGGSSSSGYTPQEAVKIVEDHYGITINYDTNGLQLQTNSGGTEYYQLQIELKNENLRKIVNVYKNGEIEEISSEPLAYG